MFKAIFALLSILLLHACVGSPAQSNAPRLPTDAEIEQYNASVPADEHIVCRDEIPVGTNIPRRKCRYVRDIQQTSTFHREQLRRALQ